MLEKSAHLASVSHRENTGSSVLELATNQKQLSNRVRLLLADNSQVLIGKLLAIDRLAASSVTLGYLPLVRKKARIWV